ncbi:hypothetical protein Tco_1120982 [Tanacetum coccineum]|uniref:Transmembrane protein n=1 Tax=Tanacetum coccineum TaxID=301880 RepID=A0ABQ5IWE2_9ASTR
MGSRRRVGVGEDKKKSCAFSSLSSVTLPSTLFSLATSNTRFPTLLPPVSFRTFVFLRSTFTPSLSHRDSLLSEPSVDFLALCPLPSRASVTLLNRFFMVLIPPLLSVPA